MIFLFTYIEQFKIIGSTINPFVYSCTCNISFYKIAAKHCNLSKEFPPLTDLISVASSSLV